MAYRQGSASFMGSQGLVQSHRLSFRSCLIGRQGTVRCRRRIRRCRSEVSPQMPCFSPALMAYSRHGFLTGQFEQIRLAGRSSSPRWGWNMFGSKPRQADCSSHSCARANRMRAWFSDCQCAESCQLTSLGARHQIRRRYPRHSVSVVSGE
jgi:hypothetical protein